VMVHWAVLARWDFWRGLRAEGDRGPVTVILPGVGREELETIVHQVYSEGGEKAVGEDEAGLSEHGNMFKDDDDVQHQEMIEYKLETEPIVDNEDDHYLDSLPDDEYEGENDDEALAIDNFTQNLPAYIVCDREAIAKAFSYIQSTPLGEKHKSGPWTGREKYKHECGFVDKEGVKCGFRKGVGVRYLMRHTQGHVPAIYWCTLCEKSVKRSMAHIQSKHRDRSLEKSLEERLKESEHSCIECEKKFLTKKTLDCHINLIHNNVKNFSCSQCKYKGKTQRQLNNHTRVKHLKSDLWPCYICGKELADKSHLDNHILLHGEATYSCEFCGVKYKTEPALKLHKKNTHSEKTIVCEYCSKRFSIKSTHDKHVLAVHTKIRNFACDKCDAKCTSKENLRRHNFIHSDEKPFECQECGKRFRVKEALTRHNLVHTGEKPYGCGQCGFRCQQSYDMTKHYKKVHDMILKNPKEVSYHP